MKTTLVLSMLTIVQLWATESYSQLTKISLKCENVKISDALKEIENQSEFYFLYSPKLVDVERKVNIDVKNEPIKDILNNIFSENDKIKYAVFDRQIILTPGYFVLPSSEMQQHKITGTVTGKDGTPVAGANVVVTGTTQGTMTDIAGKYSIEIPQGAKSLTFSFIGMEPQEITIGTLTQINVTMTESATSLEEVVVVGYGTQKKINLTGAVNQIDSKTIEDRPITNMTQALQGIMPNVNVQMPSGQPGVEGIINIRGNTSINGGSPLVLIDGVPGNINLINPRDVKSVTVLKDAAASAIYGARGAYGVLLVTTQTAKKGAMSVTYGTNYGWSAPTVSTDFIKTGYDAALLNDEAFITYAGIRYTGYTDADYEQLLARRNDVTEDPSRPWVVIDNRKGKDQYIYYANFDWYNAMFYKYQPSLDHNFRLSGGNEKVDFVFSGRYYEKDGILKLNRDKYTKYNLRSKINASINKWLKISNNSQFNYNSYKYPGLESGWEQDFNSLNVHALPCYMPYNPDGTATFRTELNNYTIGNGLYAYLLNGHAGGKNTEYNFSTITTAELQVFKSFSIVANYSYEMDITENNYRSTEAEYSIYPGIIQTVSNFNNDQLKEYTGHVNYHVINLVGTFDKSFGDHNIKIMVGFNQEFNFRKLLSASRKNLLSEELNDLSLATGDIVTSGGASEWALRSVFSRINYDYKGKYLIEFNGRYDGTSRFPKESRFGFFPSLSAGWRVSEESFFKPLTSTINNFKLRASYGTLGNQQVGNYSYISSMSTGTLNYISNGQKTQYINPPAPVAGDLTWERTTSTNLGVDLDFFGSKLALSFDGYSRKTIGMLTKGKTLPAVFGASEPRENAADLLTKGFEFSIEWRDQFTIVQKPLSYGLSFVLSDYTGKITRYDNPNKILSDYYEGMQLGEIWGFKVDGYFASDEEAKNWPVDQSQVEFYLRDGRQAGDIKLVDIDDNKKITVGANTLEDPGDRVIIGNSQPRYSYGLNANADWNGFDIFLFFQGIGKQNWFPGNNCDKFWGPFSRPYYSFVPINFRDKLWTPDNTDSYFPRLRAYSALGTDVFGRPVDKYLQNVAYLRLKNISIGYSFPSQLLNKVKIERLRVYLSAENVFIWTKLETKYIDPEAAASDTNARTYPFNKIYSMGLDLTF